MKTENIINIALAIDHTILREGMVDLLKKVENINILFDVNNGQELIDTLCISQEPDIILLDIQMPVMDGKGAIEIINVKFPNIKVIILSSYFKDIYIKEFVKLGAKAFLPKGCDIKEVINAINIVYSSGYYYDSVVSVALVKEIRNEGQIKMPTISKIKFTEHEQKILVLLRNNKTNQEIAQLLCISIRTVEGNRANLLQKTGTKNLAALLYFAQINGLIYET